MVEACRRFAARADCPEAFRAYWAAAQRRDPHRVPRSLAAAIREARPLIPWARSDKRATLERELHGDQMLRYHHGEGRRLFAGEQEVWDDASINLICWVPWGPEHRSQQDSVVVQRWGCLVGRFQLLLAVDAWSWYIHGYSFVAR